jgi:hypothetical protein
MIIRTGVLAAALMLGAATVQAGGNNGHGRLAVVSPDTMSFGEGAEAAFLVVGPKPNCDPKLLGAVSAATLQALGIQQPAAVGVVMTVLEQPLTLHKLLLQLRSGGQAFFETEVDCLGCLQQYAPVEEKKGAIRGYTFRLDPVAMKAAAPLFAKATEIGLAGVLHDGGHVRLTFVKLEGE